ncbi:MAG: hypothetical protein KC635_12630 [Myxococcales bacterium]|nr:hypothetical protein [Myxococcales bacterium]MCB9736747.1 hypothetical protein [Deltaproteobacteria bacterium]
MLRYYRKIIDSCEPFVIAREAVWPSLDLAPMGLAIPPENVLDPQRVKNGAFLKLAERLDELTYGPLALRMPSWVFYDCALVPGAVFGYARRAAELAPWARKTLAVPDDYDGLVPLSMFVAIPMAHREARLVFTLASINQVAPGAAPEGLWRLTLAAGTAALDASVMVVATQWRSSQLGLYANLGPLRILTAWTPAHDIWATLTFSVAADDAARERLLRGDLIPPWVVDRYLDADDTHAMRALQAEIEAGREVWIVGPPEIRGAETRVPLTDRGVAVGPSAEKGDFVRRFQG